MNRVLKATIIEKFGTQGDFSTVVGEREATVSRVIRCRRSLSPEKQEIWARALGCKRGRLFEGKGEMDGAH